MDDDNLAKLSDQTQLVYERNAIRFANERPKALVEKPWLDRFLSLLPGQADILDLGCGSGEPIASYFLGLGHRVVGMDTSTNLIRIAHERIPTGDWRVCDMRSFDLTTQFDGIIGWNSFFHLTRNEQRLALPNMARHLRVNGAMLLTVGPRDGEVAGCIGDDSIYHASLSQVEYAGILLSSDLIINEFSTEDPECYDMTILLAQKSAGNST